ncbi:TRIC cation channel family protein [Streptomyces sp. NWU339]|uniref:TRIC cation channel family protein n=1 Tax=Streptomyces sp. NWU339 TaxID=2185284 RepID=UPI00281164FF|nr:TRIC cation channel family protein [Streptomyces sp. NWU339]
MPNVSAMSASSVSFEIDIATRYLDLAGVFSCALLGGAVARTAGLDLFGFLVVGIISGLGGGADQGCAVAARHTGRADRLRLPVDRRGRFRDGVPHQAQ